MAFSGAVNRVVISRRYGHRAAAQFSASRSRHVTASPNKNRSQNHQGVARPGESGSRRSSSCFKRSSIASRRSSKALKLGLERGPSLDSGFGSDMSVFGSRAEGSVMESSVFET